MAKSIEKVKAGLKLRAQERSGVLTLRLGTRKFVLPFEARMLTSDDHVFVHIPPSAEIMKIGEEGLEVISDAAQAEAAAATFKRTRSKSGGSKAKKSAEVPQELLDALQKLGAGYKIGYNRDGSVKVVKARKRRKG